MPNYEIQRELKSAGYFALPLTIAGFELKSIGQRHEQRVIAIGHTAARDFREALSEFERRLFRLLDAFAISRIVAISTYGGSVFIHREAAREALLIRMEVRPDNYTFNPFDTVGVNEFTTAKAALAAAGDAVLNAARHYRESLLYGSALVATMHLLRAAEALAGQLHPGRTCPECGATPLQCSHCGSEAVTTGTDPNALRNLIGEQAYDFFYRRPGVRHDIMHGRFIAQDRLMVENEPVRRGVRDRLRSELGLSPNLPLARDRSLLRITRYPKWLESDSEWPDLPTLVALDERDELHWHSTPRLVDTHRPPELDANY